MNNTNASTSVNNENILPKMKTPSIFYILSAFIVFLIIMMFIILFDINLSFSKSKQEFVSEIFIILSFSLLVVGLCIILLPGLKEFKSLFEQIGNVTYVIIYTIFAILFYTMMSPDILSNYSYIINPIMLGLAVLSFYKAAFDNYITKFNINYERIKMILLLFCLITLMITFYNINPSKKFFKYSLLLTIIISVFAFLYIIILMTLGTEQDTQVNLLSNFSTVGRYGTILFIIFLAFVSGYISYNKESFFASKEKSASVMILLLVICILWSILLGVNLFSDAVNSSVDINKMTIFKNALLVLFGLVISGLLIFWITYNIENLSGKKSNTLSFILNLLLVVVVLGLIYKTIYEKLPVGNTNKNSFLNLILNIIFYIPSILSGLFDWLGKMAVGQYNASEGGSFMMLIFAIILLIAYFKRSIVLNYISTQGGNQLVNNPVYTDIQYNLGNYIDLNGNDNYDYQYAISAWIFVESAPPNTNPNYKKFTSLLNFGNKPNILYNASNRKLMITMQQKDLKNVTNNKLIDFDDEGNRIIYTNDNFLLQKWNNIIINYNGGTLDIFLNGELVKSSIEVVPYYTFDNLTIGENNGINGGICNVIYFRQSLNSTNIYYLYNTVKDRSPPVLNDSNETILV